MLPAPAAIRFGQFLLDPSLRTLHCRGRPVALTGKAFDLMAYMAANPGRPLLKEKLLKALWPAAFVEEANLSQNVFVVRKALGADGEGIIKTLSGRGYLFTAHVMETVLPGSTAISGLTIETTETRIVFEQNTEEHVPFWRSPVPLAFASAALILLGVAGWLGWQRWEDQVGGPPVQVVVEDLEGSTGDPVLDRTLVNVLRSEMAQSPFVTVVSTSTVRRTLTLMMRKADDPVTGQVARDLCERANSQALLHISIVRAGTHYVLTEEATNCADGYNMASAQQEVARVDDLPQAITRNGASIRHSLGEYRRTIARFNMPLVPAGTGSLEALKDYSQGYYLAEHGRFQEAIELLKHAVAIDPNFATAYLNLGIYSTIIGDFDSLHRFVVQAIELRKYATEPSRLYITAFYNTETTGDLYESIRDYQAWINVYPRQPQPWSGLTEVNRLLGRSQDAMAAAQHTLQL